MLAQENAELLESNTKKAVQLKHLEEDNQIQYDLIQGHKKERAVAEKTLEEVRNNLSNTKESHEFCMKQNEQDKSVIESEIIQLKEINKRLVQDNAALTHELSDSKRKWNESSEDLDYSVTNGQIHTEFNCQESNDSKVVKRNNFNLDYEMNCKPDTCTKDTQTTQTRSEYCLDFIFSVIHRFCICAFFVFVYWFSKNYIMKNL